MRRINGLGYDYPASTGCRITGAEIRFGINAFDILTYREEPLLKVHWTTGANCSKCDSDRVRVIDDESAEPRRLYPDDTGFGWLEKLNDIALIWQ